MTWLRPEYVGWVSAGAVLLVLAGARVRRLRAGLAVVGWLARREGFGLGARLREGAARSAGVLGLVLAGAALLGPSLLDAPEEEVTRELRLHLVVDVSRSMGVADAGPSRFESGIQATLRLLGGLPGAHVGLTVFGTSAHTLLPPTRDGEVLRLYLAALGPGLLSREGSTVDAVAAALRLAAPPDAGEPVDHILIITDGELWSRAGAGEVSPPRAATPPGTPPVHVVWTASPAEGSVAAGISRSRDDHTRRWARHTGGTHVASDDVQGLIRLERELQGAARTLRRPSRTRRPLDGAPPLAAGAGCLLTLAALLRRAP